MDIASKGLVLPFHKKLPWRNRKLPTSIITYHPAKRSKKDVWQKRMKMSSCSAAVPFGQTGFVHCYRLIQCLSSEFTSWNIIRPMIKNAKEKIKHTHLVSKKGTYELDLFVSEVFQTTHHIHLKPHGSLSVVLDQICSLSGDSVTLSLCQGIWKWFLQLPCVELWWSGKIEVVGLRKTNKKTWDACLNFNLPPIHSGKSTFWTQSHGGLVGRCLCLCKHGWFLGSKSR